MNEQPNYYAIIPANVRYCKELSAQEKLLYGEITALANSKGYCYASNNYFAELYGLSERTIIRNINNLEEQGFIKRNIIIDEDTKQVLERRIYIQHEYIKNVMRGTDKNVMRGTDKNVMRGTDKNVTYNNTSINNTSINKNNNNNDSTQDIKKEQSKTKNVVVVQEQKNINVKKDIKKELNTVASDNSKLKEIQLNINSKFNINVKKNQVEKLWIASKYNITYLEEKINLLKQQAEHTEIKNIYGFLIKALENNYQTTSYKSESKTSNTNNNTNTKNKICNYTGRKWNYEELARLEKQYLIDSTSKLE